jgi:hypothetical protein
MLYSAETASVLWTVNHMANYRGYVGRKIAKAAFSKQAPERGLKYFGTIHPAAPEVQWAGPLPSRRTWAMGRITSSDGIV